MRQMSLQIFKDMVVCINACLFVCLDLFNLLYLDVGFMCMYVWALHVCLMHTKVRRGLQIHGDGFTTDGCKQPCGCQG